MPNDNIVLYNKKQSQLDIKDLLYRAQTAFSMNQYQLAANDYLSVLKRLATQLAMSSSPTEIDTKRKNYFQIQEWLCDCYLHLNKPNEVILQLLMIGDNANINVRYLRAKAYVQMNQTSEAINELIYCQKDTQPDDDNTWINSNLLLAVLYIQNHDTRAGKIQLILCKNVLKKYHTNNDIDMIDYLGFKLEIQYHLCQIHRMNNNIDSAIESLNKAYQLYLSYPKTEELIDNEDITSSIVCIISQLFLLLLEEKGIEAASLLLNDLTLFERAASVCETNAQAKALTVLLHYAKHQYESKNHFNAANAFNIALHYIDAASKLENKSIVVHSLIFTANFYLLPEYHNTEYALRYVELAHKRLAHIPLQEQNIACLELSLLKLAALHHQNETLKSTVCFEELMKLYASVALEYPQKCNELLMTTLTLFPKSTSNIFRNQVSVLEDKLQKNQLASLSKVLSDDRKEYNIFDTSLILSFNQNNHATEAKTDRPNPDEKYFCSRPNL